MSTKNVANVLTVTILLTQALERAARLGALLRRAHEGGEPVTQADLDQLAAEDDAAKAQLDADIAAAAARQG